jgi:hypothetical protein
MKAVPANSITASTCSPKCFTPVRRAALSGGDPRKRSIAPNTTATTAVTTLQNATGRPTIIAWIGWPPIVAFV